jgi:hypothetical protein
LIANKTLYITYRDSNCLISLSAQMLYIFYGAIYSNGLYNKWEEAKKKKKESSRNIVSLTNIDSKQTWSVET